MIVELCGPPAAGKTTFAGLLARDLRDRSHHVELALSYRPTEISATVGHVAIGMRRLIRPASEALAAARSGTQDGQLRAELMRLLPPRSLFWSVRLGQYILRLLRSWRRASGASHIVVFDQAFVQALGTLILLSRAAGTENIAQAFARIPKPDLLIHLLAPCEVLEARLRERQRRQSQFERLLELDVATNLCFGPALEHLCGMFNQQVGSVTCVHADDPISHRAVLDSIERRIAAQPPVSPFRTTQPDGRPGTR